MAVDVQCDYCGKLFVAAASARRRFCSQQCYRASDARPTRERAGAWRGGISWSTAGYKLIHIGKGEPMANNNGYAPEHRLVMAQQLGRPLNRSEHVHHLNGDRTDNRPENLKLLTVGAHSTLHNTGKSRALGRWARSHTACVECGTTERRHNAKGLCVNCYMAQRR